MSDTSTLPDNLKSRISRVYVSDREFTDDNGKVVKFKRLVLSASIKGEDFEIELKADKKDLAILRLADVVDEGQTF